ncbi:class I adenylate-forming enzyme family protein [Rhizobium sp. FKY42]|uniref:class I adenylate-forming enzyme family protein n=1 Tax=Rhizobium sp. FKY42 TaxID=2562310 RepID=UPI0010BF869D|nr:class I adenylate-forming enzyme family protein [Rhizobium sp. FKY42]
MTRIEQYLVHSADLHADKNAIVSDGMRLSYADLLDRSARMAQSLAEHGVGEGERVILFLDNGWEFGVAVFAVWMAGAIICPVNPSTKPSRLQQIVQDCQPCLIITETRLVGHLEAMDGDIPCIVAGEGGSLRQTFESDPFPFLSRSTDALAAIIYTSGSTGLPKGVMLSHANLDAAVTSITSYLGNTFSDVILVVLPMSFGYGLNQLMSSVKVGATLVIERSFAYPEQVYQTIETESVTGWPIVPSIAAIMMQARELDPGRFASLRYVTCAAAPLPLAHQDWLRAFLPHADLFVMYGQTECTRATWLPPVELDRHRGSVGIAMAGVKLRIVDDEGRSLAPGQVGELLVCGPNVMQGYWRNEEATRRALSIDPFTGECWLRTGDLFSADEDGFISFVSRMDDIIKCRGEKVAPHMVEEVLCQMPGISDAVAIGVPHDLLGQAIKAVIVSQEAQMTARDVQRFCARHLEEHMVPKIVEFRNSLPKTPSGKVSRRLLIEPEQPME